MVRCEVDADALPWRAAPSRAAEPAEVRARRDHARRRSSATAVDDAVHVHALPLAVVRQAWHPLQARPCVALPRSGVVTSVLAASSLAHALTPPARHGRSAHGERPRDGARRPVAVRSDEPRPPARPCFTDVGAELAPIAVCGRRDRPEHGVDAPGATVTGDGRPDDEGSGGGCSEGNDSLSRQWHQATTLSARTPGQPPPSSRPCPTAHSRGARQDQASVQVEDPRPFTRSTPVGRRTFGTRWRGSRGHEMGDRARGSGRVSCPAWSQRPS